MHDVIVIKRIFGPVQDRIPDNGQVWRRVGKLLPMRKVVDVYPDTLEKDPVVVSCASCTMTLWFHNSYMDEREFLYCKECAEQR